MSPEHFSDSNSKSTYPDIQKTWQLSVCISACTFTYIHTCVPMYKSITVCAFECMSYFEIYTKRSREMPYLHTSTKEMEITVLSGNNDGWRFTRRSNKSSGDLWTEEKKEKYSREKKMSFILCGRMLFNFCLLLFKM